MIMLKKLVFPVTFSGQVVFPGLEQLPEPPLPKRAKNRRKKNKSK